MMDDRLLKKIRKEALCAAESERKRLELLQSTEYTLEALEEITGLPRPQLDRIAENTLISHEISQDRFFSLGQQLLWVLLFTAPLALLAGWIVSVL